MLPVLKGKTQGLITLCWHSWPVKSGKQLHVVRCGSLGQMDGLQVPPFLHGFGTQGSVMKSFVIHMQLLLQYTLC